MKIALISPKGPLYRHRGGAFGRSLRYMPLTFPTLAALVPAELEAELACFDEGIREIDDRFVAGLDADLVGMTVITGTAPRAYELAAGFRRRGIPVVLGGPHVTLVPDDAAPHADAIVVGYAEDEWPRLLRDFAAGGMRRRYVQAPDLDISRRPPPDRSVLPRRRYLTDKVFEAGRGCVHKCDFCVVPAAWGRRPLRKTIDEVVADIRRTRARQAIFVDLNLINDRDWAARLFTALIPLGINWYGLATTLLCRDPELLDLAAASGCRGLLMGFESLDADSLRRSRKGFNRPEDFRRVTEMLHRRRIALQACFVFGLDGDDEDVFERTARFAVDCGIDLPRFAVVTPFPGTELFHRLEAEGRILTRDWQLYDGQHVVFEPARMSPRTLERGTVRAWRIAYGWRGMARRLRHAAAPLPIAVAANLGYRRYARNLDRFYTCDWPRLAAPRRGPSPRLAGGRSA